MTFEDVPKYQVRLTNAHYCMDSRLGAVVLSGAEEESMFSRWAQYSRVLRLQFACGEQKAKR